MTTVEMPLIKKDVEDIQKEANVKSSLNGKIQMWNKAKTELTDAGTSVEQGARQVSEVANWRDIAGSQFVTLNRNAKTNMDAWVQKIDSSGVGRALEDISAQISTSGTEIVKNFNDAQQKFTQMAAQLVMPTPQAVQDLANQIDQEFHNLNVSGPIKTLGEKYDAGSKAVADATSGPEWGAPPGGNPGARPSSAPSSQAPGGGDQAGGDQAGGGAGGEQAGGEGQGEMPGGAGADPGLSGGLGTAPTMPPSVTPPNIPTTPPLTGVGTPLMPMTGVGGVGGPRGGGGGGGGGPRIPGVGIGGAGNNSIPSAANPVGGAGGVTTPAAGGQVPGSVVGAGGAAGGGGGVPPMMPPMGGMGGAAAGMGGRGGGPGGPGGLSRPRERRRDNGPTPGLPGLLTGKAGAADAGAFRRRRSQESDIPSTVQLIDEDLWQVEDKPAAVVEQPAAPVRRLRR